MSLLDLRLNDEPRLSARAVRRLRSRAAREISAEVRGGANAITVRRVDTGLEVTSDRGVRVVEIEGGR